MSLRNQKRAAILNRLKRSCNVRQFMKEENFTAAQVADAVLALEAAAIKQLGGPARFTGNTRTFGNGAIAYEVRCKKCRRTFWVTAVPHALCPDCE